jgi:hypothetical protein
MRAVSGLTACLIIAAVSAGCDPLERRFVNEGAGVDLYTSDRASQAELLRQYKDFVCEMAGPSCNADWATFLQAGMNDIDQRCDSYLTWLDARRRDKEPILAEISALNTAAHAVMTVTGASPRALDIVTAAFGLASASYYNWNSRLLISVNQSTVQEIVYNSQGEYRRQIRDYPVPDQPTAIYLLRNYLRLCMPITIEASINVGATLVQREVASADQKNLVVMNTVPTVRVKFSRVTDIGARIRAYFNLSDANQKKVEAWIDKNAGGVPFAFFIRSGDGAALRKMARDLNIP